MVKWRNEQGGLMIELVVALSILATAAIPIGLSFVHDQQLCRGYYLHAVAMEIVDGEMEALVAGEGWAFKDGVHPYPVRAEAAQNLPPGQFMLTVQGRRLKLEWRSAKALPGGPVVREAVVP